MYNAQNTAFAASQSDQRAQYAGQLQQVVEPMSCVAESLERTEKCLYELIDRMTMLSDRVVGSGPECAPKGIGTSSAPTILDSAQSVSRLADRALAAFERLNRGITGQ